MPPEKTYENGLKDAEITSLTKAVARIEGKLDANIEWQRGVDKRLAAGNEKFRNIDGRVEAIEHDVEKLEDRDRNLGILTVVLTTVAGFLGIKLNL